jgi:hypothetical protein
VSAYVCTQIITAEFREDSSIPADEIVADAFMRHVTSQGLHPVSVFSLTWHEITQQEADADLESQRLAGIERPLHSFRAGDWRARGIVDVAEDAP